MRFTKAILTTLVLGLFIANGHAGQKYEIDVSHSNINFTVRHMVVAKVSGGFTKFSGTIIYDEQDITKSSVSVEIKTASIDTDSERRDGHLRSADFFDVETDSTITFVSKKIEKRGNNLVAIGDLKIRGVTKQIELPFTILGTVKDQQGNTRLGIEAATAINRFDYGVKWDNKLDNGSLVVGEKVDINLTIAAKSVVPKQ
ncbi:YceI family protein [candidate division KSB1 bacterium]|nr:YceI family protein [candidate division KSB1 bacterium]